MSAVSSASVDGGSGIEPSEGTRAAAFRQSVTTASETAPAEQSQEPAPAQSQDQSAPQAASAQPSVPAPSEQAPPAAAPDPAAVASALQSQAGITLTALDPGLATKITENTAVTATGALDLSKLSFNGLGDDLAGRVDTARTTLDYIQNYGYQINLGGDNGTVSEAAGATIEFARDPSNTSVLSGIVKDGATFAEARASLDALAGQFDKPPVAPSYLNPQQAAAFDKLVSMTNGNWARMDPATLQQVLGAATLKADGTLDMSRVFGGSLGYDAGPPKDVYGVERQLSAYTDESGQTAYFYQEPTGTYAGDNGEAYETRTFTPPDPSVGTIVTETRDGGGDIGTYQVSIYKPSDATKAAFQARVDQYDQVFGTLQKNDLVQVRPDNGTSLNIGNENGYRSAENMRWSPAVGLYTSQTNYIPEEEGGFWGFMSDLVETVVPIAINVIANIAAPGWGGAIASFVMSDGDLKSAVIGGVSGYLGATGGLGIDAGIGGTTGTLVNAALNSGVTSAGMAALSGANGEDILTAGLVGAVGGAAGSGAGIAVQGTDLAAYATQISAGTRGIVTAALNDGDVGAAVGGALAGIGGAALGNAVAGEILSDATPATQALFANAAGALASGTVTAALGGKADGAALGAGIGAALGIYGDAAPAAATNTAATPETASTGSSTGQAGEAVAAGTPWYDVGGDGWGTTSTGTGTPPAATAPSAAAPDAVTTAPTSTVGATATTSAESADPLLDFMVARGIIDPATGIANGAPATPTDSESGTGTAAGGQGEGRLAVTSSETAMPSGKPGEVTTAPATAESPVPGPSAESADPLGDFMVARGIIDPATGIANGAPATPSAPSANEVAPGETQGEGQPASSTPATASQTGRPADATATPSSPGSDPQGPALTVQSSSGGTASGTAATSQASTTRNPDAAIGKPGQTGAFGTPSVSSTAPGEQTEPTLGQNDAWGSWDQTAPPPAASATPGVATPAATTPQGEIDARRLLYATRSLSAIGAEPVLNELIAGIKANEAMGYSSPGQTAVQNAATNLRDFSASLSRTTGVGIMGGLGTYTSVNAAADQATDGTAGGPWRAAASLADAVNFSRMAAGGLMSFVEGRTPLAERTTALGRATNFLIGTPGDWIGLGTNILAAGFKDNGLTADYNAAMANATSAEDRNRLSFNLTQDRAANFVSGIYEAAPYFYPGAAGQAEKWGVWLTQKLSDSVNAAATSPGGFRPQSAGTPWGSMTATVGSVLPGQPTIPTFASSSSATQFSPALASFLNDVNLTARLGQNVFDFGVAYGSGAAMFAATKNPQLTAYTVMTAPSVANNTLNAVGSRMYQTPADRVLSLSSAGLEPANDPRAVVYSQDSMVKAFVADLVYDYKIAFRQGYSITNTLTQQDQALLAAHTNYTAPTISTRPSTNGTVASTLYNAADSLNKGLNSLGIVPPDVLAARAAGAAVGAYDRTVEAVSRVTSQAQSYARTATEVLSTAGTVVQGVWNFFAPPKPVRPPPKP